VLVLHNMFIFYCVSARLPRQNIFMSYIRYEKSIILMQQVINIILGKKLHVLMNTQIQIFLFFSPAGAVCE